MTYDYAVAIFPTDSPPVQSAQQSLGVARQTLVFKSSTESQAHLPAGERGDMHSPL